MRVKPQASVYQAPSLPIAISGTSATAGDRVFELRTYACPPGKLGALNERFRSHTITLFRKLGMEVVGFWEPTDKEAGAGEKLIYLLAHASRAAAEASWKAFHQDPQWIKVKSESEAGGALASRIESLFLAGTDYSPLR